MRVQFLYFEGCPNWRQTLADLRATLREAGLPDAVELLQVTTPEDAAGLRFVGSPTVLVNSRDVEPNLPDGPYGLGCRVYWVSGRPGGTPPAEWLRPALVPSSA
ncbi:MAG: hypothetical protein EXR47_04545 [Dehalococcoidia bacterium]|nr:hypothetical protein [Dehalococcoidia bacterium]